MKILHIALLTILVCASQTALSQHDSHTHAHHHEDRQIEARNNTATIAENAICQNLIDVKVNGLVCDFCARALEKVFRKQDSVQGIDVDLNNGSIQIAMKDGQTLDNNTVTKLITDSGYNVVSIKDGC